MASDIDKILNPSTKAVQPRRSWAKVAKKLGQHTGLLAKAEKERN